MLENLSRISAYVGQLLDLPPRVEALRRAGLFDLHRPDEALRSLCAVRRLGPVAGAAAHAADRTPQAVALVDEVGALSYAALERRSNALARAWTADGLGDGSVIAVLCRDHRWLIDSLLAAAKIGARTLLMNTGFSGPQLAAVAEREGVHALAYDQEFSALLGAVRPDIRRYLAWVDDPAAAEETVPKLAELIAATAGGPLPPPRAPGGLVLLTSGTTGTPKGAPRQVSSPLVASHFLERVPLRRSEATFIASPVFHATGFSQLVLAFGLSVTVVVRRRFDAEETLRAMSEWGCSALIAVPTMLRRILDLGSDVLARYDLSALRIVLTAGSVLPPEVSNRALRVLGNVVYNLYGSTEMAVATIATPGELRAAPGTVGRPPRGCVVRLYDADGKRVVRPNVSGRIFVGSELAFGGYTGGGTKQIIDGLLASGDIGHFDSAGLLFVDGRDDDMIVSGGENVFPAEIENLLMERADVADAAVIGVPDADFGQRLKAFLVPAPGCVVEPDEIKEYVWANLARFKVPREVVIVARLPRNPTGKLLRGELTNRAAQDG